jgi:DNA-binding transcriptional LysR family regulator
VPDPNTWRFTGPEGPLDVCVKGAFIANDSVAVLRAARSGHGIALLHEIQVVDDLQAGRLCRLLKDYPSQILSVASQSSSSNARRHGLCDRAGAGNSGVARDRH